MDELPEDKKKRKIENDGLTEYIEKHVWRFELSINSQGTDILNMKTGELFRLSPEYLDHYDNIRKIFFIYAGKYFDFRINTGQKRIRDYRPLKLFENSPEVTSKPYYLSKCADTGRIEKICYNRLRYLAQHYVDMAASTRMSLQAAMDFLLLLSNKKAYNVYLERYVHYLDSLVGGGFIDDEDKRYFALLAYVQQAKLIYGADIDNQALYDFMQKCTPTEEEMAQIEADAWAYDCEFWQYLPDSGMGDLPR